jgi:hypothetical protein
MEAAFEADDPDFFSSPGADAVSAREFNGAFGGFGACGEQENFVKALRSDAGEKVDEVGALLAWEAVVVDEAGVDLVDDGFADFRGGVAGVGDENAAGPIEPAVAELS